VWDHPAGRLAGLLLWTVRIKNTTGTIDHNLFMVDFHGKPRINLEKTIGLPIPTLQEP
jgi:hypothetical protein